MVCRVIQGRMLHVFAAPPTLQPRVAPASAVPSPAVGPPARTGAPALAHGAPQRPGTVAMRKQDAGSAFRVADSVLRKQGPGQALPEALRGRMEAAMRADFAAVRVHVGPQAQSIGAVAFTTGNDLFFAPGQYRPDTQSGRELIGHELAHVVQQRQGRVGNPFGTGIAMVQDRRLEAEADMLARRALAHCGSAERPGTLQPKSVGLPGALHRQHAGPPGRATLQPMMGAPQPPPQGPGAGCRYCLSPVCVNGSKCGNTKGGKYGTYQYGGKKRDQRRLSVKYKKTVSGRTHQAEHPYGFAVLRGDISGKRGKGGVMRRIEQTAPAYQEHHRSHRDHIGTGNSNARGGSGINSAEYREWTGQALRDHNPEIAIAINQMDYAHMDRSGADPTEMQQADDSFNMMVRNMGSVPMGSGGQVVQLPPPTPRQRLDMLVIRWTLQHGRDPNDDELLAIALANNLLNAWADY